MPIYWLDERLAFPDPRLADESGLLAVGGDLSPERLVLAYRHGIFPWFDEDESPILWHAPHNRFVITPESFRFGRSIRRLTTRHTYTLTYNRAFTDVLRACASVSRPHQDGTWLGPQMMSAYQSLHKLVIHSAEAFYESRLVGGVYGVLIGKAFFGESMFSLESGASKIIFAELAPKLFERGIEIIDCQMHTEHLARFGAYMMSSSDFMKRIVPLTQIAQSTLWPS